jgi:tetratricopeptide (TPR) repeat protein
MQTSWSWLLLTALSWATPMPARAAGPSDAAASQALFERGREAAARGELALACSSFAESQRLDPGAGTLMNLATCEARQGKLASAWQHFQEAAALLRPGDDRVNFVDTQIRALAARLPRLSVRLASTAPASARVLRNGTELGPASMGVALPVDPGSVELLVECAGRQPRRTFLPIAEGEQLELTLEAGAPYTPLASAAASAEAIANAERGGWQRNLGISLVALGSLGATVGLASGIVVAARKSSAEEHCPAQRCDAVGLRAADSGERWLLVNTVAWSVGAAAVLSGGALWLTAPSERREAALHALPGGAAFSFAERF